MKRVSQLDLEKIKNLYLTGNEFEKVREKDLLGKGLKVEGDDGCIYDLLHELAGDIALLSYCPGKEFNQRRNRTYFVLAYQVYGFVIIMKLYDQLVKHCNKSGLKVEMTFSNCHSVSGSVVKGQVVKFTIRSIAGEYTPSVKEAAHDALIVTINRLSDMRRKGTLYD